MHAVRVYFELSFRVFEIRTNNSLAGPQAPSGSCLDLYASARIRSVSYQQTRIQTVLYFILFYFIFITNNFCLTHLIITNLVKVDFCPFLFSPLPLDCLQSIIEMFCQSSVEIYLKPSLNLAVAWHYFDITDRLQTDSSQGASVAEISRSGI